MRNNPLRATRQSNPFSLQRAQRDVSVRLVGEENQPRGIRCESIHTGTMLYVSESQVYAATFNSWCPLDRCQPHSVILRELLTEGATLATTKALFKRDSLPHWKEITTDAISNAVQRNLESEVKCHVRRLTRDSFAVRCQKGHDHQVKFRLRDEVLEAACIDCPSALGRHVCHHVTAALAIFVGCELMSAECNRAA